MPGMCEEERAVSGSKLSNKINAAGRTKQTSATKDGLCKAHLSSSTAVEGAESRAQVLLEHDLNEGTQHCELRSQQSQANNW